MITQRGSYARRTETPRKFETRPNTHRPGYQKVDAHEQESIKELLASCERFYAEREMKDIETNRYKPAMQPSNKIHVARVVFVRKQQEPTAARSLKAAVIREIVLAARRAGLIKDGVGRLFGDDADAGVPDGLE